jgi:hypothetical protein
MALYRRAVFKFFGENRILTFFVFEHVDAEFRDLSNAGSEVPRQLLVFS